MNPIYVIGSSNTDMVIKASKIPAPGETILGDTFFMNPGGKGANQAVAAARLGGNVSLVANVGNDLFGRQSIDHFKNEGIHTEFISVDKNLASGVAFISLDQHGENCITVVPGSNGNLQSTQVDKALSSIQEPSTVLLQLEIPINTVAHAIRKCSLAGHRVILNPAPAQKLSEDLLQHVFLITPNESEAELITGINVTDPASAARAAHKLLSLGVSNVVITMGSKGAYIESEKLKEIVASPVVKAIDTTAAGDCFNGAIAVSLSEGQSLDKAVAFACRAAAISVTRLGAQASMPYLREM